MYLCKFLRLQLIDSFSYNHAQRKRLKEILVSDKKKYFHLTKENAVLQHLS